MTGKASYDQFCDHYNLDPQDEMSKAEYENYLEQLEFTKSLFAEKKQNNE